MPLVGTSLNAVTTTGPGIGVSFDTPKTLVQMQVSFTGSPTTLRVDLEASADGINFFGSGQVDNSNNPGHIQLLGDRVPVISARANLVTLSGGTSPTVTAVIIAAAD
jgi:hypothetical protein